MVLSTLSLVYAFIVLPPTHYTFSPGYLADGGDLGELFFDIGDAKQYCDAEPSCKGFTFKQTTEPVHKLSVRFKSTSAVTHDPSWLSYTKSSSVNPYFYATGFLGDGTELHSASLTLAEAQAWCDANENCKGFSAEAPKEPSDLIFARFVDSEQITYDGDWMSYTKLPTGKAASSQSFYTYHPGYLGDGVSIHESFMTLDNAKAYCEGAAKCAGFTIDKAPEEPTSQLFVRFKSSPVVSYDARFASYTKDHVKSEL